MTQNINSKTKNIYIVITQTGTILSKILKFITKADYNHVSVSVDSTLNKMYSFGRKNPYYPFWGGYVEESINKGTFKRFSNTDALVLSIQIEEKKYNELNTYLSSMYKNKNKYKYNYIGLLLAGIHIKHTSNNKYYCSEFVKDTLIHFEIATEKDFEPIVKPIDFINLKNAISIYQGKLKMFNSYQPST